MHMDKSLTTKKYKTLSQDAYDREQDCFSRGQYNWILKHLNFIWEIFSKTYWFYRIFLEDMLHEGSQASINT